MDYRIGQFVLSTRRLQLLDGEIPLPLEPQVFALLRMLIENHDRVVTRDEIFEVIWKGRIVSDAALSSRLKDARAALGDDGRRQRMIRTVHGKGFHFVGSVEAVEDVTERQTVQVPNQIFRPSLALLPVEMQSPTQEQRAFGDGLSQDIANALGRIRSIFVAANHGQRDPQRVAMDLGVRYILSKKLRFSGSQYRLNATLLDATRMQEVWADQFSGEISDPFAAQDKVTSAVLGSLVPNIVMVEVRRAAEQVEAADDNAYYDLLRAIPLCWTTSADDNRTALDHLARAIERSPDYALAHALVSWCRAQEIAYVWTDDPTQSREAVQHHARLALRAAPTDSMVLTFVGHAKSLARDQTSAEHHIKTALELDPNSAWAWSRLGFVYVFQGRLDDAIEAFNTSQRLSPLDPMRHNVYFGLGASQFFKCDYETALRWFEQALIENPDMIWAHRAVAACAAELGDMDRAHRSVKIVRSYLPEATAETLSQAIPVVVPEYREQLRASYEKAGF